MTKLTPNRKEMFLQFIAEGNTVTMAARAIGVTRQAAYKYRELDDKFRQEWDFAVEEGIEILENVAITRAKENSDLLLMFMLKAKRPDVYREKLELTVNWRQEARSMGLDPEQHLQTMIEHARAQLEANANVIDVTPEVDLDLGDEHGARTTEGTDRAS